ncbi:hypothetical protein MIND_01350400 [Mycena indigotica]|uniref:DUF6533 domain-containing protein n=1 Tax=Mycena indigotica TaxID=2126181 RepID=A0A8H6S0G4_9AGAR|nr:uncharacterized protein MIND_01350400 [Mycena indigotica]KAF7289766.1 hypothetical protein MIND_01350400 [Mycena indigotica]
MDNVTVDAELVREIFLQGCLHLIGISLLYYDHLITFGVEFRRLWRRKRTSSANWFFSVRYAGLLGNTSITVLAFYTLADKWCGVYHISHQIVIVGTQFLVCIIMLLRTYALYNRNRYLIAVLLLISACLVAVVIWSIIGQESRNIEGFPGCHVIVSRATQYHLAAAWEALFVFDTLIFALTLYKTWSTWRIVGSYRYIPMHTLMLRDGALYFGIMVLANLGNIFTFYFAGVLAGSLSTIASCISVTMVSRLMLNLHERSTGGILSDFPTQTHFSLSSFMGPGLPIHAVQTQDEGFGAAPQQGNAEAGPSIGVVPSTNHND